MGILRVDHPDILEFISCKVDNKELSNFNISVAVTEEFMRAVETDGDLPLINPHNQQVVRTLKARDVFDRIVEMAWKTGDPGIMFLDRINRDNPTPHLGEMESTNPCGEQPLLPYEPCNLGSINLALMLNETSGGYEIDWDRLEQDHTDCRAFSGQCDRHEPLSARPDRPNGKGQPQDRPRRHGLRGHADPARHPL